MSYKPTTSNLTSSATEGGIDALVAVTLGGGDTSAAATVGGGDALATATVGSSDAPAAATICGGDALSAATLGGGAALTTNTVGGGNAFVVAHWPRSIHEKKLRKQKVPIRIVKAIWLAKYAIYLISRVTPV